MIELKYWEHINTIKLSESFTISSDSSDRESDSKNVEVWTTGYFEFENEYKEEVKVNRDILDSIGTKYFGGYNLRSFDVKKRVEELINQFSVGRYDSKVLSRIKSIVNSEISEDLKNFMRILNEKI